MHQSIKLEEFKNQNSYILLKRFMSNSAGASNEYNIHFCAEIRKILSEYFIYPEIWLVGLKF